MFIFPANDVRMKAELVSEILDWKKSSACSSILFDRRFVSLLNKEIVTKGLTKGSQKKKHDFIKGIPPEQIKNL